jgi:hypothetical protein
MRVNAMPGTRQAGVLALIVFAHAILVRAIARLAYKTRWTPATLGATPIAECVALNVNFKDIHAPSF